jgi:hypothetical protein
LSEFSAHDLDTPKLPVTWIASVRLRRRAALAQIAKAAPMNSITVGSGRVPNSQTVNAANTKAATDAKKMKGLRDMMFPYKVAKVLRA